MCYLWDFTAESEGLTENQKVSLHCAVAGHLSQGVQLPKAMRPFLLCTQQALPLRKLLRMGVWLSFRFIHFLLPQFLIAHEFGRKLLASTSIALFFLESISENSPVSSDCNCLVPWLSTGNNRILLALSILALNALSLL